MAPISTTLLTDPSVTVLMVHAPSTMSAVSAVVAEAVASSVPTVRAANGLVMNAAMTLTMTRASVSVGGEQPCTPLSELQSLRVFFFGKIEETAFYSRVTQNYSPIRSRGVSISL